MKTEAQLVRKLRGEKSFRQFEDYLNEKIPEGMPGRTTFASAWNWVYEVYPVTGSCIMAWLHFYPNDDPRHQLAIDILALRRPGSRGYDAKDGQKLLEVIK